MVTNAEGATLPALDFEKAPLKAIEDFIKLFGSVPYEINAPVMKWMTSDAAPRPFGQ
jgi:glucan 1,3-beta-glucosidase